MFVGKWIRSKSTNDDDGTCPLVKKIYLYRKLKSVYDFKYLIDIVCNQNETIKLLKLPGSKDILASNVKAFGFKILEDQCDLINVLALAIVKLVNENQDELLIKHFESKEMSKESNVESVKEILKRVSPSANMHALVDFISTGLIFFLIFHCFFFHTET